MTSSLFRKAVIISALWHTSIMCLFSLSSGGPPGLLKAARINFFNGIIPAFENNVSRAFAPVDVSKIFLKRPNTAVLDTNRQAIFAPSYYAKPQALPAPGLTSKVTPVFPNVSQAPAASKKEPVVMFYPSLPEHVLLYFTDRQAVHIELKYNITSAGPATAISLKRKISSGNLEADLLTMRYISHYLFIQRSRLPADSWQTVKIELSPKHDQP